MITALLGSMTSDIRNTIGCLVVLPILVSCLHYCRYKNFDIGGALYFNETADNLVDYHERDHGYDDVLREEVVEITFDLGSMEGDVRRFLSRIHRVVI